MLGHLLEPGMHYRGRVIQSLHTARVWDWGGVYLKVRIAQFTDGRSMEMMLYQDYPIKNRGYPG